MEGFLFTFTATFPSQSSDESDSELLPDGNKEDTFVTDDVGAVPGITEIVNACPCVSAGVFVAEVCSAEPGED